MSFKRSTNQKIKRITSFVILGLGAILICLSIYAKIRISDAKDQLNHVTKPLGKNPFSNVARNAVELKASQYQQMIMWCTTGGIILVVVGGALYFVNRKK